jgi:cytochrome b subunit of formate dehydrogenase
VRSLLLWLMTFVAATFAVAGVARSSPLQVGSTPEPTDPNRRCMQCHGQPRIAELNPSERRSMVSTALDIEGLDSAHKQSQSAEPLAGNEPATRPGLLVDPVSFIGGPHEKTLCIECHTDSAKLPHAAVLQKSTCARSCHAQALGDYEKSSHREAILAGNALSPTCASCHGGHDILRVKDRNAPQHKLNSMFLCGDCHMQHRPTQTDDNPVGRVVDYLDSAHARAVARAGLTTAATCADCHGAHGVRPSRDPDSAVSRANVPDTCGKCHVGVLETYSKSVHGLKHAQSLDKAAVCSDCHTSHQITQASASHFAADVLNECGSCHDSEDGRHRNGTVRIGTYYQTYLDSYHGQVTTLGGTRAARCSDCHGAHDILPLSDPASNVSDQNLIATCAKCHPGSNANFVKFDPHANYRDRANYPLLHGVWLYFMILMSVVFTFFGVHTILWFLRSAAERRRLAAAGHCNHPALAPTAIRRFTALDRVNHALVALTFFGLTATGIPLVFAEDQWAKTLASAMGGIEAAGLWHRVFAVLLIANLALHFLGLARNFLRRTCSAREWFFGPNSLLPRWKDAKDAGGMFRWFLGGRSRPRFDRWTYWEKFDYWAEVGGSVIIGGSGLFLWFPELTSLVVPGWIFNVAMIVHGYEALLAICFIFTIHFFNAHLRPGAFPVDEVIFTGSLPEEELKEQRPEEYERLVRSGQLETLRVPSPDRARRPAIVALAIVTVGFGLLLLTLILIGGLT